jgi:hypothetical protein
MAGKFPDDQIASTLNRLGLKTGAGNTWREGNIRTVRSYQQLPVFTATQCERNTLTNGRSIDALGSEPQDSAEID